MARALPAHCSQTDVVAALHRGGLRGLTRRTDGPFHERLAQVGLAPLGRDGFALASGYAVQAHGLFERPSEDVDMFTT
jgi:hypothetical protein